MILFLSVESRDVEAAISSITSASTPIASTSTNKNEKTTGDNFFLLLWVSNLSFPTLYHFEETKTYRYIALTLPTSLKLMALNNAGFVFS